MDTETVNERPSAPWGVERSLWFARWAGAAVAVLQAALIDPADFSRPYLLDATYGLGAILAGANLAAWPALRRRRIPRLLAALMFGVDLSVVSGLVWLFLDNPDATQWVLFMIIQLEAAYRWDMRGAVGAAGFGTVYYGVVRAFAADAFGFDLEISSVTYVGGLLLVQGLVVGGMARRLRAERDASMELSEAALALNVDLDRLTILTAVAAEATRLASADHAVVWVPDPQEGGFVPAASHGLPAQPPEGLRVPTDDPLFGESTVAEAFRTSSPVLADLRRGGERRPVLEATVIDGGWRSVVSVPILHEGSPLGVLSCYLSASANVTHELVSRLSALVGLAAVSIANAASYERERAALESMRELDRLKDDFLSTVSHELRTPLTVVGGFATTLRSRWDELEDDRRQDLVRRIEAQATGLHERIGDLLEFSRLRSGEHQLVVSAFGLSPLVTETVNRLEPHLGGRELTVEIPEGLTCWSDPMAVAHILENLLLNAARYSEAGSPIDVNAAVAGDGFLTVSVTDRGIGIPEYERERIFERFYRGQGDDVRRIRGTGIGLAIVKELSEALGGGVEVSSDEGEGSTFTVRLPAEAERVPEDLTAGAGPDLRMAPESERARPG